MENNFWEGMFIGIMIVIATLIYMWSGDFIWKTPEGKHYIKTHGSYYKLESIIPIKDIGNFKIKIKRQK